MKQVSEIWETYRSCWSEKDSNKRIFNLENIMSDNFQYKDPNIELIGFTDLSNYMIEFQEQYKDSTFEVTSLTIHHNSIMANWSMLDSKNEVVANGVDFAKIDNGRIKEITGFFKEPKQ